MEAKFTQKGLEGGLADIVLTLEEGETFAAGDGIALGHETSSGTEYLGRDKGQWGAKKESLRTEGEASGNTVVFRLESYYVNCLSRGGYVLTLLDASGKDKYEAPFFADGVKKSSPGVSGYSLAEEADTGPHDAAAEELAKALHLTNQATSAANAAVQKLQECRAAQKAEQEALAAGDLERAQQEAAQGAACMASAEEAQAEAVRLLTSADGCAKNGALAQDAVKAPQAMESIRTAQAALDALQGQLAEVRGFSAQLQNALAECSAQETARRAEEVKRAAQETLATASEPAVPLPETGAAQPKSKTGMVLVGLVALVAAAGLAAFFLLRQPTAQPPAPKPAPEQAAQSKESEAAESQAAEAAARAEAERKAAEAARADARGRVATFFAGTRSPEGAMQLAGELATDTPEQQDAVFRLYYYAAEQDHAEGALKCAQCLDPSRPAWGSIKKDAAEAWYYYGKHADGKDARERMKAWVQEAANKGDVNARQWMQAMQ
ncbi:MAG: hypothetical protein IJU37_08035 [Desulfovibrio sp.]|nr:hypothetical protein [Desulfovibrio sp.]